MGVSLEQHDGTAVLRIDRPPLNALDGDALEALLHALAELAARPPARGAVLTGAGKAFTTGIDTRVVAAADEAARAGLVFAVNRLCGAVYLLPFPVVAAFNGHAIGAGAIVGLACDRRIAARGPARFGLPEVTAGIPYPAVPLEILREHLPEPHRSRLMLGGESIDVEQAQRAGLVDDIVEPAALLDSALAAARTLAAGAAHAAVKRQLRAPLIARIEALLANGTDPLVRPPTPAA